MGNVGNEMGIEIGEIRADPSEKDWSFEGEYTNVGA